MIKLLLNKFNNISQSISWFIGSVTIMFFIYMMVTGQNPNILINWGVSTLGLLFIVIFITQLILTLFCLVQLNQAEIQNRRYWFEFGLQVSNSISTIALTFTLFGISLGIGELSTSNLDISTINKTIGKLTEQFSMAFMTSVVGLPTSAILKSILIINFEHILTKDNFSKFKQIEGE